MFDLKMLGARSLQLESANITLGQHLDRRLERVLSSLGQSGELAKAREVVALLCASWSGESVARGARWKSDITDDHSPFEFSLALNGESAALRILTEPQDPKQPSLAANWRLGEQIHEQLEERWGAGFDGYKRVADLFRPGATAEALFSIWHCAILTGTTKPQFKVYLNPAIHGAADATRVVEEALGRLGLGAAWRALSAQIMPRQGLDQVVYFSIDLLDSGEGRAKVYVAHRHATDEDVAAVLRQSPGFSASQVRQWCRHLMAGNGPFLERPPITCFAVRRGSPEWKTTTLHLPVRSYASDDLDIARKVCAFLPFSQRVEYLRALTDLAERPLESGRGLQTYVSLRASPGREAMTVYLAPEVYSAGCTSMADAGLGLFERAERERRSKYGDRAVA